MLPDDAAGALAPAKPCAPASRTGSIFFLGDPLATLDQEWDSSLRLMAAHRARGDAATWSSYDDVLISGRTLVLNGRPVGEGDLVWLRFDPSVSVRYYETLRALCHVDARFINRPETVLTVHDKRSALSLCPRPTWSVFAAGQLAGVVAEMAHLGVETAVLKPPSLFASKGVRFLPAGDRAALEAGFADLVGLFGYVIVEPYLGPGGGHPPVDMRVLMTSRRVIGAIERVIPVGGGLHDVKRAGPFTPEQARLVQAALEFMRAEGIFLAGLDFLGDTLTELNVSCPGAIPEINLFCDVVAEEEIIADVHHAWVAI
ncbi:MAG: ATP-grasp domain-containing protein [Solirubrobacterales bacterium]